MTGEVTMSLVVSNGSTDLYCTIFIQILYLLFEAYFYYVLQSPMSLRLQMAASSVERRQCSILYVDISTQQISRIVVKQTTCSFNWETFSIFIIIETLQNYFTCELLPDYLSSKMALHFNVNQWRPCLVVSSSEQTLLTAGAARVNGSLSPLGS